MKLQKALEKAKQARQGDGDGTETQEQRVQTTRIPDGDWKPPTYSESAHVMVDPMILEQNRCVGMFPDSPEIDFYKILRTQVEHRTKEQGWNAIMITSVQPREGKTLTAINLALTFAKAFSQTVLLVDCDLRQQMIHHYLGIRSDKGLADYLMDDRPMKDIIIWPGIDKMTVISGGRTIKDSAELLGSPRMKAIVEEMKHRYDDRYVIFDTPPILTGADTIAFAPLVDGIIVVVEEGKTSMRDVTKAMELIPHEKMLGFVLNKQRLSEKDKYLYGSGS
ncbi:MAG: polysaccharide biosynthesis tyrosine autokinase [Thermodesulfobacteriota bacterium]